MSKSVHHINGDRRDNRPENLRAFTNSEHSTFHNFARRGTGSGRDACPAEKMAQCLVDWDERRLAQPEFIILGLPDSKVEEIQ